MAAVPSKKEFVQSEANIKVTGPEENSAYEMALVGSDGLATETTESTGEAGEEDISIADVTEKLAQMKEDSKEDIKKAAEIEKQRDVQRKKDAIVAKKKKEQDKKEAELEKQVDPDLKLALSNEQFTEDMLGMLLK